MASEDEVCRAETEGTSLALPEDIDARVEILEVDEPPVLSPVENFPTWQMLCKMRGLV